MRPNPLIDDLNVTLRLIVAAQDDGVPVGEMFEKEFGLSFTHALMDAAHTMRLRMAASGLPVRRPASAGPEASFILGFDAPEQAIPTGDKTNEDREQAPRKP